MKHIFTSIYTLLLVLTCTVTAFAQTSKITGSLKDGAATPVEFATVSLLRAADSAIVKGAVSNENGNYIFDNIAKGNYVIKATSVGYNAGKSAAFSVDGTGAVTVASITLTEGGKTLNTVNVNATKPLIERKVDRTVMNVENSVLAAGNTAMEILERAPGVTIDKDDNISLRGKQGVTIMINDKLTYLSQAQLATLLRSTDGNTIASIEIITNPSAKYDAAGNSGIINIKLKKNKQKGTNGSLTAGYARGRGNRDNMSLNINHKNGPLSVFGTISRGDNNRYRQLIIDRVVPTDTPIFNQVTEMPQFNYYNNFNIGADLETSSKNTIGVVASGYSNGGRDINDNLTKRRLANGQLTSYLTTYSTMDQRYKNLAFNVNDRYKIDTLGQELGIDLDYSKFTNTNMAEYNTNYYLPNGSQDNSQKRNPLLLRNQTPSSIQIYSGKADYTKPLSKTWKLESGLKFSSVKTDNDLRAQIFEKEPNDFINDKDRTNHFIYTEQIAAAYTNISHQFKNGSIQLGLRAENTTSDGNLIGIQQVKRSYLNFFPSLFINRSIGKKHDLGFTYSRRIDRPNYDDLNPFVYYLDPFTFNQGNAFLKPQYTNNFELNYTYNKTVDISIGYSHTTDVITELILTRDSLTFQTNANLRTQKSYNVNIFSPFQITKWWTGNINFNGFYLGFKSNGIAGGNVDNGRVAFTAKTTQTFVFGKYKAEIVGDYRSSLIYGIYYLFPRYAMDAGVSRSFANKKLNVKIALNDVFNTMRNDLNSQALGNDFSIRQKSDTRVFRVNVTYNFGSTTIKARQHRSGAESEKGRVNSGN